MGAQARARGSQLDRAVAHLAARQHGVVTRAQLVELGLGRGAVRRRPEAGRIHRIHRGVYAAGHPGLTQEGLWLAGVFGAGRGAALSHRSAAALWQILPSPPTVEVTVPIARSPGPGILAHEGQLPPGEVVDRAGIPVTIAHAHS
jgi:hypothetical protein